jgi:hypothetical protein
MPSILEVSTDPRIELLGVVQALAGARGTGAAARPWSRALESRFGRWRGHAAVSAYRDCAEKHGGEESYALILLFLGEPPKLAWTRDRALVSVAFIEQAGGAAAADAFLAALRDFAAATDFMTFHEESRARLLRHRRQGERLLAGRDYLSILEEYVGGSLDCRYRIVWPLLYAPGRLTSFIIPYPYRGPGRPAAGPYEIFTIPVLEAQRDRQPFFVWSEPLYIPIERAWAAAESGLSSLPPDARSQMVSAVAWRLTIRTFYFERTAAAVDAFVRSRVAPTTLALYRRLEAEYEGDRERYPTLALFFPRLVDALRDGARAQSC